MNNLRSLSPRLFAAIGLAALLGAVGLVASRPAHSGGGPVPVTVTNTVQNRDVDTGARQPVEIQPTLTQSGVGQTKTFYTVPAGKRLVIEYVNVVSNVPNDTNRYSFVLTHNGVFTNFSLVPDGCPFAASSQRVMLYAEAGTEVAGFFNYNGSGLSHSIYCTISGHLVDVP